MNYILSKSTQSTTVKAIVSVLAIASLLSGTFQPRLVSAEGAHLPVRDAIGSALDAIAPKDPSAFPVAENKTPVYEVNVIATAYSSDPYQTDSTPCYPAVDFDMCAHYEQYGTENTIAANFLPKGTLVKLPELYGDKVFVVRDRMNARYNGTRRIDVWVGSETPRNEDGTYNWDTIAEAKNEAKQFGTKYLTMEVYGK